MINTFYRATGLMLSPSGPRAKLSILIYHRVLPDTDELLPGEVSAQSFEAQMIALKSAFNVLPLSEAIARLKSTSLPARAACITFDDGYADNASIALPILQRHGLPATFFIATAYLNGGRMFNDTVIHAIRHSRIDRVDLTELGLGEHELGTLEDKRKALSKILWNIRYHLPVNQRENAAEEIAQQLAYIPAPKDLMMDDRQVKAIADAGMEIGGHTANHPILARLDTAAACQEVAEGKEYLEALLGAKVTLFAYPNGRPGIDYLPEQTDIPRKLGFESAVSTHWGAANKGCDIFQLPRFTPHSNDINKFTPLLFQNLMRKIC
jgi:peptidoglycan/xylan/chitin deacetylase (PgdA/CDA1 family)